MIRRIRCRHLLLLWVIFIPWFVYGFFVGENSLFYYRKLREDYEKLKSERNYWALQNDIYREKITAFERNKKFYYEKLAREMFIKGRKGEKVVLFVRRSSGNAK